MPKRFEYENRFRDYPDVLTIRELAAMLGDVSTKTAATQLRNDKIKHFHIGVRYLIPKTCVIDFMMSKEYPAFKKKIDRAHLRGIEDKEERGKQKILYLCDTPQTRKKLMVLLDVKSKKTFFRAYLKPLLESGQLLMTHPDQPSISTQEYIRNPELF